MFLLLGLAACASALAPSAAPRAAPAMQKLDRRAALTATTAAFGSLFATAAFAVEDMSAAPPKSTEVVEIPTDFGLTNDYYADALKVVQHMRLATALDKGAPNIEKIALKTKKEMNDFVAFYRRFTNVSGKQSYSTLYTSINVLAGHYTSYGPKFPVPEKRRKRLYQEYTEIEKNLKKRR